MKIAIGSDHRGFRLKKYIKENLVASKPIIWNDVGTYNEERTDYPLFTLPVCLEILQGNADYGIVICGTGVGVSIAANRFAHIYAGLAWNDEVARLNKEHDNANILILPADFISNEEAIRSINSWLNAEFKGSRYQKRLDMVDAITEEAKNIKSSCC